MKYILYYDGSYGSDSAALEFDHIPNSEEIESFMNDYNIDISAIEDVIMYQVTKRGTIKSAYEVEFE